MQVAIISRTTALFFASDCLQNVLLLPCVSEADTAEKQAVDLRDQATLQEGCKGSVKQQAQNVQNCFIVCVIVCRTTAD